MRAISSSINIASLRWMTSACLALCALNASATSQDAPPEPVDVLQRFVGDWTTETQIRRFGPPVREFHTRGTATCRPTLEGRYFEFRTESVPPGEADLQIMTYDEEAQIYRQWVFSSDGYQHDAIGTWDAATSVLHWKGQTADSRFEIEDHWVSRDRLEWMLRRTDADGKLSQKIEGTVLRAVDDPR